jgi:hypothetical protein
MGEGRSLRQSEPLEGARALDGDEGVVVGGIPDLTAARLTLLDPRVVGLPVRGVDDEQELAVR